MRSLRNSSSVRLTPCRAFPGTRSGRRLEAANDLSATEFGSKRRYGERQRHDRALGSESQGIRGQCFHMELTPAFRARSTSLWRSAVERGHWVRTRSISKLVSSTPGRSVVLFLVGSTALFAPFLVVAMVYRDDLQFAPVDFMNKGLDFAVGLLSMLAGFVASELYWKRRNDHERRRSFARNLLYHVDHMARTVVETSEALARDIQAPDESRIRDREAVANLRRIGDAKEAIQAVLGDLDSTIAGDRAMSAAIAGFRLEVAPRVTALSRYPDVRPQCHEIEGELAVVGRALDALHSQLLEVHE